jgi:hypothetical protein
MVSSMIISPDWHLEQMQELKIDKTLVRATFSAAQAGDVKGLIAALTQCKLRGTLAHAFRKIGHLRAVDPSIYSCVASWWQANGYDVGSAKSNDRALVRGLRVLLPPYIGPEVRVFRGQQFPKLPLRNIGMCWTNSVSTAERDANDFCQSSVGESVILEAIAKPSAVILAISGRHDGNQYGEAEYIVDPTLLENIRVRKFSSSSRLLPMMARRPSRD